MASGCPLALAEEQMMRLRKVFWVQIVLKHLAEQRGFGWGLRLVQVHRKGGRRGGCVPAEVIETHQHIKSSESAQILTVRQEEWEIRGCSLGKG